MGQGRLSSKAGCALSQPCTTWECAQPPTWNMRHIHAAHSAALQQRGSQRLYCSEEQTRHCTSCISSARPAKAETQGGAGDSVDVEIIHSLQRQNGKGEFFCLVNPSILCLTRAGARRQCWVLRSTQWTAHLARQRLQLRAAEAQQTRG